MYSWLPYNSLPLKEFDLERNDEANVESSDDENFNPLYVNGQSKNASKISKYNSKNVKNTNLIANKNSITKSNTLFNQYKKNKMFSKFSNHCSTKTSVSINSECYLNKTFSSNEIKNSNSFITTLLDNNLVDLASKIAEKKELSCMMRKLNYSSEEENLKHRNLFNAIKELKCENAEIRKRKDDLKNENYNLIHEIGLISDKTNFHQSKDNEKISHLKDKLDDLTEKLKISKNKIESQRDDLKREGEDIKKRKAQLENEFVKEYEAVNLCKRVKFNMDIKDKKKNQSINERSNLIHSLINDEDVKMFSIPITKDLKNILTTPDEKAKCILKKHLKKASLI